MKKDEKSISEVKAFKSSSYLNKDHLLLKQIYRKKYPDGPCLVEHGGEISHCELERLKNFTKRRKQRLAAVEYVPSNIPHFTFGTSLSSRGKVSCSDRTGLFRLEIVDGERTRDIYVLKRLIGSGKNTYVQGLYCTDFETQRVFLKMFRRKLKTAAKPKRGVFEAVVVNSGMGSYLTYNKLKVPTPPVMHQNLQLVTDSVEKYFENRERYLRNGKSGSKRALMFGNAGSGKSTIAYQIAKKYEKTHCVVFATNITAIAMHTELCAKHKVPTIVVAEECDKWMGAVDHHGRADGNVKAFLDGYMSHRNTAGEFSLLVTNYPDKIEKTIIFRPGRIHERIHIGALDAEHAVKVARHYFKDEKGRNLCPKKELEFLGELQLTGAQIENIATLCVDAVNGTDEVINSKLIKRVIDQFSEAVSSVKDYKDDETIVEKSWKPLSVGFGTSEFESPF